MVPFDTSILDAVISRKRKNLETERQRLLQVVKDSLFSIQKKYQVKEAYIVGSLLFPLKWWFSSDIDVAISGTSNHILEIMKDLENATDKEVDVIDLDHHPHREIIITRGIKVYG